MTPLQRCWRILAVRFSRAAAERYAAAVAAYAADLKRVSDCIDVLIGAMDNVLTAIVIDRSGVPSDRDLGVVVVREITHASFAVASAVKAMDQVGEPQNVYLTLRQVRRAIATKAATRKVVEAAADLLLICESPPSEDFKFWISNFAAYGRRLFVARTDAIAASMVGAAKGHPAAHLVDYFKSFSIMNRLAFDLFMNDFTGERDPSALRSEFETEAVRATEKIALGRTALSKYRRKLTMVPDRDGKIFHLLDSYERSFEVESNAVGAFRAMTSENVDAQALCDSIAMLQAHLKERGRLTGERLRIIAA